MPGSGQSYESLVLEGGVLTFWGGQHRLTDINTHCLAEFRKHWECLDNRNQQLWQCRPAEWKLSKCVFDNLVRLNIYPTHQTNTTIANLTPALETGEEDPRSAHQHYPR